MTNLINGDARHIALADESVQCIITSPPYWALRSYLAADDANKSLELGGERVPDCLGWATGKPCGECYVCHTVAVMRECWRVLRSDGTCWLNLGDSYAANRGTGDSPLMGAKQKTNVGSHLGRLIVPDGLKPKDLCLIPSRVALALQAAGWWVRSEIIWHKPNPMPESVTDRPTKAHEMIYLLTKRAEYYYDAIAIQESAAYDGRKDTMMKGSIKYNDSIVPGQTVQSFAARGHERWPNQNGDGTRTRNRRSVWTVASSPYSGAHFATFPPALVEPMILAGSRPGDIVFDPFSGSGTVGKVAIKHGRRFVGNDLNLKYMTLAVDRTSKIQTVMPL